MDTTKLVTKIILNTIILFFVFKWACHIKQGNAECDQLCIREGAIAGELKPWMKNDICECWATPENRTDLHRKHVEIFLRRR